MDQYMLYSQLSTENVNSTQNNIQEEIKQIRNINDFNKIENFINMRYGSLSTKIVKKYANDIVFLAVKDDYTIEAGFVQKDNIIFGKRWKFVPEESSSE